MKKMNKMNKILTSKIGKSVLILIASIGVFFTIDYFTVSQEASAVVCEVGPCPCGKVLKKSGAYMQSVGKQDTISGCVWPNQL